MLTLPWEDVIIILAWCEIVIILCRYAEVSELADELDSGSSGGFRREGSSPFFRIVYKFLIDCLAVVAELAYALD